MNKLEAAQLELAAINKAVEWQQRGIGTLLVKMDAAHKNGGISTKLYQSLLDALRGRES